MADINSASQPAKVPYQPPRRSFAGPLILIILGVLLLLGTMHVVNARMLLHYFGRYWPVLIILWGLIKVLEYFQDQSAGRPSRGVGAGGYVFLVFLILIGLGATVSDRVVDQVRNEISMDSDLAQFFGKTFDYTQELQQDFPAGASLRILGDRTDLTITPSDQPRIRVVVRKTVYVSNDNEAQGMDEATRPKLTVEPNLVTLDAHPAGDNKPVRYDMEIYVPKKAPVDITTRRGNVTARGMQGDVNINTARGDITLDDIAGSATINVGRNSTMGRGSLQISKLTGNVSAYGYYDEVRVSNVGGAVTLDGEFFGGVEVAKVTKAVRFKSSRTELEFAKLDGDLTLDSGDLHGTSVVGPVRLVTHSSKDIHLDNVSGAVTVENRSGSVELYAAKAPLGAVTITNRNGDVQVRLPANAAFQLDASASRGDISSDYEAVKIDSTMSRETRATGSVGANGPRVQINNEHGNIEIRKAG